MMSHVLDDLGGPVPLSGPPARVVSLVPSLTEAIALTIPGALVGATDWCTRPEGLDVARVRGTKNPNLAAIRGLRPDLVVANQEENRKIDVERLRAAGVAVWVTRINSVDEAFSSMGRLFREAFGMAAEPAWLHDARGSWPQRPARAHIRVAVPVWRDPWIWVGGGTYASDVMSGLGWHNVVADTNQRYPHLPVAHVLSQHPDLILLPDEPYPFQPDDGPAALAPARTVLVPGRWLSWYGPAMLDAPARLQSALR
jgi:ABC-type Fe3+-hydroxamate transport system substrate-binding protein